jgi:hypothetical protein
MHELKVHDNFKHMQYCEWFSHLTINAEGILDITFSIDEAWFHLSGYINPQNSRMWSAFNPQEIMETPFLDQKVGVVGNITKLGSWSHSL